MGGLIELPVIAKAVLLCDARYCGAQWVSPPYNSGAGRRKATEPAFDAGWRLFRGQRTTYTYCPQHGPKVSMRLVRGGDL